MLEPFMHSSFGRLLLGLFSGLFTAPSQQSFMILACGWALTRSRHTVSNYIWLSGGAAVKHFSRFYGFLGGPFYQVRETVFARIINRAAPLVPTDEPIRLIFDGTTRKKCGRNIQGAHRYRNEAGTARQEYRTLWGLHFVLGILLIPLSCWKGHFLPLPIGLSLYLKEDLAKRLGLPFESRSALARKMYQQVAHLLPHRHIQVCADGEYATRVFLQHLPANVEVVSRFLISGQLYAPPISVPKGRRGPKPKKGPKIGSPKLLAEYASCFRPHPSESGAFIQSVVGIWHSVLPGQVLRVVLVKRPDSKKRPLEAFFTTNLALSTTELLAEYHLRWKIEIDIREANQFYGLAKDQCRVYQRIVGVNAFRFAMASARTLWFLIKVADTHTPDLLRFRPWYQQKQAPTQLDISWAAQEALWAEGIRPIPRFLPDLDIIPQSVEYPLRKAG